MKIIINSSLMVPIYEQIVDQIKTLIRSGELKENDCLPSVRALAKELKISALTVKKAPITTPPNAINAAVTVSLIINPPYYIILVKSIAFYSGHNNIIYVPKKIEKKAYMTS